MQVIIGQYSQLGVSFMKHLVPIGHGFSYVLCINAVIDSIENGLVLGNIIMYLLSSVQRELLWMECPKKHMENCFGKHIIDTCQEDCLNNSMQLSSELFYTYVKPPVFI